MSFWVPPLSQLGLYLASHFERATYAPPAVKEFPKMFLPDQPGVEHDLRQTLSAIDYLAQNPTDESRAELREYLFAFAAHSYHMKNLDQARKPLLPSEGVVTRPGYIYRYTYPDMIVALSGYLPFDRTRQKYPERVEFLKRFLAGSITFQDNLKAYGYPEMLNPNGAQPSAVWTLRAALRRTLIEKPDGTLGATTESTWQLKEGLVQLMPEYEGIIQAAFEDFRKAPLLGQRCFDAVQRRVLA